jgi:hypothetical protein
MKKIKFTYVDSITEISVSKEPAKHGPQFPKIKGLQYLFALERKYPTMIPEFIGECDDDADLTVDGFLKEIDQEEFAFEQQAEIDAQTHRIRVERTLRLQASDWTQVADAPVDQAAWATYRQALRDVPAQDGFPWNVVWPDAPTT